MTIQQLAQQAYDAMERRTRDNGEVFYAFADGSPEWMTDVARTAHGDMFPDDWRYAAIHSALGHIADATEGDDLEDAHDFADSHTGVYTSDLLAWLGSHGDRIGYVDEAREELGTGESITTDIMRGMYTELAEVYTLVLSALTERADEDDGDDED